MYKSIDGLITSIVYADQDHMYFPLKKSLTKLIKIAERIPADLLKTHMAVTYTVQ